MAAVQEIDGAARVSKFKKLGLALSEQLSRSDVERLKHLVSDHIPQGKAEGIENGLQLLKALEQKDIVNARDVSVLIEIFEEIRRNDLVLKIKEYAVGIKKEFDSKEPGQDVARGKGDFEKLAILHACTFVKKSRKIFDAFYR